MVGVLKNNVLPVVCPKCGAQMQKTIGWFRENNEISCPWKGLSGVNTTDPSDPKVTGSVKIQIVL
jgi:hypothetical protein